MRDIVRLAREEANLTQRALGKVIGVSGGAVAKYELGTRAISLEILNDIAKATGRELLWFLEMAGYVKPRLPGHITPADALKALSELVTQSSAAEPSAEPAASQLEALRAENAALREQLAAAGLSAPPRRQIGQPKDRVPPRKRDRAGTQKQADAG